VIFMDIENNVCDFYIDIEKIARDFDGCWRNSMLFLWTLNRHTEQTICDFNGYWTNSMWFW
jgi:predicted RNA-binding protein associated with RNAse of E/G family